MSDPQRNGTSSKVGLREWCIRLTFLLLSLVLSVGCAELGARAFWLLRYRIPFRHPDRVLYAYYKDLRDVEAAHPVRGGQFYNILILGASTLHPGWGEVEQVLSEELAFSGHRNVRIFNLSVPAQSSRDSRIKYAALRDARFDLVMFYHGINEARTNNVPPELFREDFGHYAWYEMVNALAPYHGSASFALPYTVRYVAVSLRHALMKDHYVPIFAPRKDWVQYGRDHRSTESFKHNLEAILDLAWQRGDPVLLMTFATYVPKNYSLQAFQAKRLDYGLHSIEIERWGRREDVLATVAIENDIVRQLAAQREGVLFVDQARLMADSARYFNDACHFTVVGSEKFVENLLPALLTVLRRSRGMTATVEADTASR